MGLNINLVQMMGFPRQSVCPNCKTNISTGFSDYDIEGSEPKIDSSKDGTFSIRVFCEHCGEAFPLRFKLLSV